MAREIVLDTETTGLDHRRGHKLIEVACLELEDFLPTGQTFHQLIYPDRDIDPDAERIHGISLASLKGKPRFHDSEICDALLNFIGEAPIVAHNASFDRGFINAELMSAGRPIIPDEQWIDTFSLAQKRFPGMYNSLDALCKRFKVSLSEREKHGALIDTHLLAAVYLELRGGRERGFDLSPVTIAATPTKAITPVTHGPRPRPLSAHSTETDRKVHADFIRANLKDTAIWLKYDP